MDPTFRFDSIDILINRNSLRKFFKFCLGSAQDSFRINLHLVNNTLIVERCVRRAEELLNGSTLSGFGHNFERAVTRLPTGLLNSSAHHRVLRYKLGGLECAVRFEVDASYNVPKGDGTPGAEEPSYAAHSGRVGSLEAGISLMSLGNSADGNYVPVGAISRGPGTSQTSVTELKSCKTSKKAHRELQQLWFGRTRYLITGYHENGMFDRVKVDDLQERLMAWENNEAHQTVLRKMVVLLSRLRDVVGMTEGKSCVAIFQKGGKDPALRVFASTSGKRPLPNSIIEKFWKT